MLIYTLVAWRDDEAARAGGAAVTTLAESTPVNIVGGNFMEIARTLVHTLSPLQRSHCYLCGEHRFSCIFERQFVFLCLAHVSSELQEQFEYLETLCSEVLNAVQGQDEWGIKQRLIAQKLQTCFRRWNTKTTPEKPSIHPTQGHIHAQLTAPSVPYSMPESASKPVPFNPFDEVHFYPATPLPHSPRTEASSASQIHGVDLRLPIVLQTANTTYRDLSTSPFTPDSNTWSPGSQHRNGSVDDMALLFETQRSHFRMQSKQSISSALSPAGEFSPFSSPESGLREPSIEAYSAYVQDNTSLTGTRQPQHRRTSSEPKRPSLSPTDLQPPSNFSPPSQAAFSESEPKRQPRNGPGLGLRHEHPPRPHGGLDVGIILPLDYSGMSDGGTADGSKLLAKVDFQIRNAFVTQLSVAKTYDEIMTVLHVFREIVAALPLPPAMTVRYEQAVKDAKRESITLNGTLFVGNYKGLASELQEAIRPLVVGSTETLDVVCRDILRASSRTASGGDSYSIIAHLFTRDDFVVTPSDVQSKPISITIDTDDVSVSIISENRYLLRKIDAGDSQVDEESARAQKKSPKSAVPKFFRRNRSTPSPQPSETKFTGTVSLTTVITTELRLLDVTNPCVRTLCISSDAIENTPEQVMALGAGDQRVNKGSYELQGYRNGAPWYMNNRGVHITLEQYLDEDRYLWIIGMPPLCLYGHKGERGQAQPPSDRWKLMGDNSPAPAPTLMPNKRVQLKSSKQTKHNRTSSQPKVQTPLSNHLRLYGRRLSVSAFPTPSRATLSDEDNAHALAVINDSHGNPDIMNQAPSVNPREEVLPVTSVTRFMTPPGLHLSQKLDGAGNPFSDSSSASTISIHNNQGSAFVLPSPAELGIEIAVLPMPVSEEQTEGSTGYADQSFFGDAVQSRGSRSSPETCMGIGRKPEELLIEPSAASVPIVSHTSSRLTSSLDDSFDSSNTSKDTQIKDTRVRPRFFSNLFSHHSQPMSFTADATSPSELSSPDTHTRSRTHIPAQKVSASRWPFSGGTGASMSAIPSNFHAHTATPKNKKSPSRVSVIGRDGSDSNTHSPQR